MRPGVFLAELCSLYVSITVLINSVTVHAELAIMPTSSPTSKPTELRSQSPTTSRILSPVAIPSTSPSVITKLSPTSSPINRLPSVPPSNGPTLAPFRSSPTAQPSQKTLVSPTGRPTLSKTPPSARNPSLSPLTSPTTGPTKLKPSPPIGRPTLAPTFLPTMDPTMTPAYRVHGPFTIENIVIELSSVSPLGMEDRKYFEQQTKAYFESFYENVTSFNVTHVTTYVTVTKMNPDFVSAAKRKLQQSSTKLLITYGQIISFRCLAASSDNVNTDFVHSLIMEPFINIFFRQDYIGYLRRNGRDAFKNLTIVGLPTICGSSCNENRGVKPGLITGVVVAGSSVFFLAVLSWFYFRRLRGGYDENTLQSDKDDISTLEPKTRLGMMTSASNTINHGEGSVGTVDYDYSRTYGGGADHSVSSAGGTLGSATRQSKFSGVETVSSPALIGGVSGTSLLSDEASFEARFRNQQRNNIREETLYINAPPGKLGVVIDTPENGGPVVHAIKDSSVLVDQLRVGDKILAVDEDDVRSMSAVKVSKLISRKSSNSIRRLTIVRTLGAEK